MQPEIYDLIVIGGGSGGLTAAIGGAGIGAKVLLIEKDKIGGDCTHYGCIPSKTLIKTARVADHIRNHDKYGLQMESPPSDPRFALTTALQKVQDTVQSIADHETPEAMKQHGVDAIIGSPTFVDDTTVAVNGKHFTAKRIVLATGSRARSPKIEGLEEGDYMTNHHIFNPADYKSLLVIGTGPIGCELGQAFSKLGVDVQLTNIREGIMGREDSEASRMVQETFQQEGIKIHTNCSVDSVERVAGQKKLKLTNTTTNESKEIVVDQVLVAIGRVPNIEGLDLEKAGIEYSPRGITINAKGQTTNKRVYAVGDVTGSMQFTHLANHHGKAALASMIFKLPSKYETEVIPRVTFTTPEVASVGISEDQMKEQNLDYLVLRKDYSSVDRAITDSNTTGFFKYIVDKKGYIKGAVIVGEGAGELIGEIAVAMKNNLKITKIADTIHPYPTYGYGLRNAADLFRSQGYTPDKKKWVKKIFGLHG